MPSGDSDHNHPYHVANDHYYKCEGDSCTLCYVSNHLDRFYKNWSGKILTFIESISNESNVEARKDIVRNLLFSGGIDGMSYIQEEIIERVAEELNIEDIK